MLAPEWQVARWFNAPGPLSLAALRGKVVLAVAFQMLCPGCVAKGLPQAQRVRAAFDDRLVVLGLHSVFEHHDAQGSPAALAAFLHEYRIGFPVALDAPAEDGPIPHTMRAYGLRGTPSALLIDKSGRLRMHEFGHIDDLVLGATIGSLLAETGADCGPDGCPAPTPA
ncbi:MAG: redoxin domain-containing protein [Tagaea sp.]|nr:redoxin domain-containing protein [Tagaea sp.]